MIVGIRAHDLVKGNIDYVLSQAKEYGFDAVQLVFKKHCQMNLVKTFLLTKKQKTKLKKH